MPWSPIPKFPKILQNILARGFMPGSEVHFNVLRLAIMEETGVMKINTMKVIVEAMCDLNYIKKVNDMVYETCSSYTDPGKFKTREEAEDDKIDALIEHKTEEHE